MHYKSLVQQIADLDWAKANAADIVLLSGCTAIEFADSLRLGTKLYPNDERLIEMANGELQTDNMFFDDYHKKGDHWEFLDFFIKKFDIQPSNLSIVRSMEEYAQSVQKLSDIDRAMTVFSREEELTGIFKKIVRAHNWNVLGYGFYQHYLESHIQFDSGEKGHHHLTQHFPLHEKTLETFYQIRLKLYSVLF